MKPFFPLAAAILTGLMVLGGCATHDATTARAQLNDPNRLAAVPQLDAGDADSNGRMPRRDYWKALGDPQLDDIIAAALAGSPGIKVADARLRHASALIVMTRSATLPNVSGDISTTSKRFSENWIYPSPLAGSWDTDNTWAINGSLNLDLWGKYRSALHGAQAEQKLAAVESEAVRIALASTLARAWVELDRLYRQRHLLDQALATRLELEHLQALRVQTGLDADFDRTLQRQSIAAMRTERGQLDERIGLQRNLIAALSGQGPDWGDKLANPALKETLDAALPSSMPADLLGYRPDVMVGRWRVEAASYGMEVAEKEFYPDVNLGAFIGLQSIGLGNLLKHQASTIGLAPAVHLPIFEGGSLQANLDMRSAEYDAAVEQYNQTLVDALRDVFDQARSLNSAQRQSADAEKALSAVQRNAMLVETRFMQGLISKVAVLSAQMQVMAQQRINIDLHARKLDVALSLERALGGGFLPEQSPFTTDRLLEPADPQRQDTTEVTMN